MYYVNKDELNQIKYDTSLSDHQAVHWLTAQFPTHETVHYTFRKIDNVHIDEFLTNALHALSVNPPSDLVSQCHRCGMHFVSPPLTCCYELQKVGFHPLCPFDDYADGGSPKIGDCLAIRYVLCRTSAAVGMYTIQLFIYLFISLFLFSFLLSFFIYFSLIY